MPTNFSDYMFYYFAPLVSFWFLFVYVTMRIGSAYNNITGILLVKIMVGFGLVYLLMKTDGPLRIIFGLLDTFLNIKWDLQGMYR